MGITYYENEREFHLYNEELSYIIKILPNNQLGNLYYGKRIREGNSLAHLFQGGPRSLAAYVFEGDNFFSLQHTRQEYPAYGTTDFRYPAFEIFQANGSNIMNFEYQSHSISKGKKKLERLPATYVESDEEADTLEITLFDTITQTQLILSYTIYTKWGAIARNTRFIHQGLQPIILNRAMSMSVDLPDYDYEMIHFSGAWARERHIKVRKLEQGVQSIHSMRGTSSAEHNPFMILKRPNADEHIGEVYGFSFIYSGNFLAQVEVDTHDMTRVTMGIHPDLFEWELKQGETFQTPEVVMVYSDQGLNKMSQIYHELYHTRLVRGKWRDKVRPIVCNNWEATGFDFNEEKILSIAKEAAKVGVELFVLDDGWFGERNNDKIGLGDWSVNKEKLPSGIKGLAQTINKMGMDFGLWIEPEMVNKGSKLYKEHPEWVIHTPGRSMSHCRNQYVLDYSKSVVVDYIYEVLAKLLRENNIAYIKWDMNRYLTECYSDQYGDRAQGKVMHQYILGVYELYERLTTEFPEVLFESCSSGGARFDPGMMYYAPQAWTSDNTDAGERMKIQYATSYAYPLSTISAHVSQVPNEQTHRTISLETRGNVALFGVFGYELDLGQLSASEIEIVKKQIQDVKRHRELIMNGDFYRLENPFTSNLTAWMVVSKNKKQALVGYYKMRNEANKGFMRLKLKGLEESYRYEIITRETLHYGDELMYAGLVVYQEELSNKGGDYSSVVYELVSR